MNIKNLMKKNSFLTSSAIYVFGSLLVSGFSVITTPIFTRLLTPEDYGITSVFATWVSVFTIFIGLQTSVTIAPAYIHFEKEKIEEYLSSILFLSTISFLVISTIVIINRYRIASILNISVALLTVLLFQSFFGYIQTFYNTYLIQTQKPIQSLLLSVSFSLITMSFSLILIFNMESNRYIGKIMGNAVSTCLFGICLYFIVIKNGRKIISFKYWKYCLPLAIPNILSALSFLILGQSDRIMLQNTLGNFETGIYSFAYSIASILFTLWASINNAWVPWYFENTKLKKNILIHKQAKKYIFLISIGTCVIMLMTPEAMKILGPQEYWSAGRLISIVILGSYFYFLAVFSTNYQLYCQNTKWIAIGTVMVASINIGLNIILIPIFKSAGAAIATLISYFVLFIFQNLIVIKMGGFNISQKLYIYGIGMVSFGFIIINITYTFPLLRWIIIACLIVYIFYKNKSIIKELKKKLFK